MFTARKKQKTSAATYLVDHARAFVAAGSDHGDDVAVDEDVDDAAAAAAAAADSMDVDADECLEDDGDGDDDDGKEFEEDVKHPVVVAEEYDDDDDGPIEDECAGAGSEMRLRMSAFRKRVGITAHRTYAGPVLGSEPTDSEPSSSEDECV